MSEITVVTGLPRSGTSLMMQILNKAGIEILQDGVRESDISNPQGYFELEAVKGIVKNNSFLKDALGKAVKIVAPLPMFMDPNLNYKVIFMRRDIEEILMSQETMLKKDQSSEREKFKTIYELHLKKTYKFFKENDIPFIDVDYNELMENASSVMAEVKSFTELQVSVNELVTVINPDLYRNRRDN